MLSSETFKAVTDYYQTRTNVCVVSHYPVVIARLVVTESVVRLTHVLAWYFFYRALSSAPPTLAIFHRRLPSNIAYSRTSAFCLVFFFSANE